MTAYRVQSWGGALCKGATGPVLSCTLPGVAKANTPEAPYVVANELVCGRLAMMLGLPVPPGVVVRSPNGGLAYVSVRLGDSWADVTDTPTGLGDDGARSLAIAAGAVAFDAWVYNPDRHRTNVAHVPGAPGPVIFDHAAALFGMSAREQLTERRDQLPTAYDPMTQRFHLRTPETVAALAPWCDLITHVPDDLVAPAVREAVEVGALSAEDGNAARAFLLHRKAKLSTLLASMLTPLRRPRFVQRARPAPTTSVVTLDNVVRHDNT